MANETGRNERNKDQREENDETLGNFPGNPNRQKQDSPRQQQGDSNVGGGANSGGKGGAQRDPSRLHEDRSVTDRTVRKSVIEPERDDDGEIDRLKP